MMSEAEAWCRMTWCLADPRFDRRLYDRLTFILDRMWLK
jgi:hypothetical protein